MYIIYIYIYIFFSFWRYKNEPKYVLSSNVPILHTSILQFGCCWTLTDGVWVPLINHSAPSVDVGWHVIPTKQPASWSPLTWWFRLTKPSQNARNIQVWNSSDFSGKMFPTQMWPTDVSYNFPSFLPTVPTVPHNWFSFRKQPSSGVVLPQYHCAWMSLQVFAFDTSGGHGRGLATRRCGQRLL